MSQRFTYSIPPHALSFLATASQICVAKPRPTFLSHPVQPLKGLRSPRAASVSYRALAPDGANQPFGIERKLFKTPIRYSSFFILHSSLSYTFSAKEKDSETGLSYFGSRYYSSGLSIWLSVDPMSDKYPSLSPYTYCANNPVKLVDPDGREITLETIYKKDANGNDTKEIERYNIRITGKIVDMSRTGVNTAKARDEIVSQIESSFSGVTKKGIPVTTTADFKVARSYKDVGKNDHVIILSNGVPLGKDYYGCVNKIGGSTAWVDAKLFKGLSGFLSSRGAKTAAHEMGHLMGLGHNSGRRNLMFTPYRGGGNITSSQLSYIIRLLKAYKDNNNPYFKNINNFQYR